MKETDSFLEESEQIYKNLKEQCDDLDTVLANYDHKKENDNTSEKDHR